MRRIGMLNLYRCINNNNNIERDGDGRMSSIGNNNQIDDFVLITSE